MTDKEIRGTLIELLQKYPDAPIRAVVDEEIVTGEYSSYIASIYDVYVNRYVHYKDTFYNDENELFAEWFFDVYEESGTPTDEVLNRFKEEFDNKWEEAIFIHATA